MRRRARAGVTWALALTLAAGAAACSRNAPPPRQPRRIVDLSPPITADLNLRRLGTRTLTFLGTDGQTRSTPVVPAKPAHAFGISQLELLSHTGAHLDAPARLLRGGEHPAQIALEHLFGPARVLDLRWHDRSSPLQISDLELTPIAAGEIVILLIGYEPPAADQWPRYASLSQQASEWLVAKQIRALATDMPAIVSFQDVSERLRVNQPPESVWAEYIPLFQAQIPVIAGLINLEIIVGEPDVDFVGFPLALVDADGAPVRAAALVY